MAMIKSILENDLYKFSMGYYYQVIYPEARGTFAFKDRNNLKFNEEFITLLKDEFRKLDSLYLTDEECEWAVKNIPYIPRHYWEWLKTFRFKSDIINMGIDSDGKLFIEVTDFMYKVTMYEIPILAIVSELYYKYNGIIIEPYNKKEVILNPLISNIQIAEDNNIMFAEFGMRRRFSHEAEDMICQYLSENCKTCVGTSTVYFAKKYNMKPIGTQAHEIYQFTAAVTSPCEANYIVMENWMKVYDGYLGTILTDTFTVNEFLRSFSMKHAKLYDGVRHDSGCPFEFGEKMIKKYQSYNIDPMSKTIVFSDALTFEKCVELKEYFKDRIKVSFGIGTNITNNIYIQDTRVKPLNIVNKLSVCRINERQPWRYCVKLSDNPIKANGNKNEVELYKRLIGIE
jgi:nicotinate phosphoribosyltransferase